MMSIWHQLIKETTVQDLCRIKSKRKGFSALVVVTDVTTVQQTLRILSEANVLSAPVVNDRTKEFLGFVDMLDIAGWVLAYWKEKSSSYESGHFPTREFFHTPICSVLNFSSVNPEVVIDKDKSIAQLIDLVCNTLTHRVAVLDKETSCIVNVLSQSDIVAFSHANLDALGSKAQLAINNLNPKHPIFVRIDTAFIDALELLYANRISGLALVDEDYHLCGNLSASDLRGLAPFSFDFFNRSVLNFLAKGSKESNQRVGPVYCKTDSNFLEVIETAVREKVHRVYLTDSLGHPQGVISLVDIIAHLI